MPRLRRGKRTSLCSIIVVLIIIGIVSLFNKSDTKNEEEDVTIKSLRKIGIGGGGAFFNPMIDPSNENNTYVTCDMGGLYYSHNKGQKWERSSARGVFTAAHITNNGTVFVGGYGLYTSQDRGKTLQMIYPQNVRAQVSRYGWNENLMLADNYNNGYIKAVTSFHNLLYFITIDWYHNVWLMQSNFIGNNLNYLLQMNRSTIEGPSSVDVFMIADNTGVYYTLEEEIHFYSLADNTDSIKYISAGHIKDFKKIDSNFYIIEDIDSISQIIYTQDFIQKNYLNDKNDLSNTFTKDKTVKTFTWNYTQLHGVTENNIFILTNNLVVGDENDVVYGVLKYNGSHFDWVFDENVKTKENLQLSGWSYGSYGPLYGVYANSLKPHECLVSNIETVYLISYESNEKSTINNLHSTSENEGETYTSTGLDVQTTYWVRENPQDDKHVIIATTDMGLQISRDGSMTWKRMTMSGTDWSIYNTCYDLYFDPIQVDVVYGLWSSIHDAPYTPMSAYKDYTKGRFAISLDGGSNWNFTYSSGIPEDSIPIKMSVKKNGTSLIIAVATFNRGFYISKDSGKTFTDINEGMEYIHELIFGEDVIIVDDDIYCLTAPFHEGENWLPSRLYKYSISNEILEQLNLGNYTLLRSITYHSDYGLLLNSIPKNHYQQYDGGKTGIQVNYHGGVFKLEGNDTTTVFENTDGIFNSVVDDRDKTLYAVDTYGKIWKYNSGKEKVLFINLDFMMLKNICFSNNKKFLYVTSFGGGTFKIEL